MKPRRPSVGAILRLKVRYFQTEKSGKFFY